jgi:hypothetical protein
MHASPALEQGPDLQYCVQLKDPHRLSDLSGTERCAINFGADKSLQLKPHHHDFTVLGGFGSI